MVQGFGVCLRVRDCVSTKIGFDISYAVDLGNRIMFILMSVCARTVLDTNSHLQFIISHNSAELGNLVTSF